MGLEPISLKRLEILSLLRLPISPLGRSFLDFLSGKQEKIKEQKAGILFPVPRKILKLGGGTYRGFPPSSGGI